MEIWKEVRGHLDYAISTQGRVRRLTKARGAQAGRILKPALNSHGYPTVCLYGAGGKATRRVHTLVCDAFLWPRGVLQTNHLNGIKIDNRLCNLELVTRSENTRHAYHTGLMVPNGAVAQVGEQRSNAKLSEDSVRDIRALKAAGITCRAIGERFGVSRGCIDGVVSGRNWKHVAQ